MAPTGTKGLAFSPGWCHQPDLKALWSRLGRRTGTKAVFYTASSSSSPKSPHSSKDQREEPAVGRRESPSPSTAPDKDEQATSSASPSSSFPSSRACRDERSRPNRALLSRLRPPSPRTDSALSDLLRPPRPLHLLSGEHLDVVTTGMWFQEI